MPTVTVVTGGENTGRKLIGFALASYINCEKRPKRAIAVDADNIYFAEDDVEAKQDPTYPGLEEYDDIILISKNQFCEEWMNGWFLKFGKPLFNIISVRIDGK